MPFDELLPSLVKLTPGQERFLSVYLDLRPHRTGKKLYPTFLRNCLSGLATQPLQPGEQILLEKEIKAVQKYLEENLDPSWKGIALFSSQSAGVFVPIPLPLAPENALSLGRRPHLFALLRQAELFKPHAVAVADSRRARLLLVRLGAETKEVNLTWEETHNTRFGRMGLSLARFQRHQREHGKQRAREIADHLEKMMQAGKAETCFLVAEEGMEAEIRRQWPVARNRPIPLPGVQPHDAQHKILAAASDALLAMGREKAAALARQILEEAGPLGQATVGPEPTLSALQNHRVERIVFDPLFHAAGWRCDGCHCLGVGGTPSACPVCTGGISPGELREEIACQATAQGVGFCFTGDDPALRQAGGIAALLKYRAGAKTAR